MKNPLEVRPEGLYCKPGKFYIDAWSPVDHCIITHAHADHVHYGHRLYTTSPNTADIILRRLGSDFPVETLPYEQTCKINQCWVSLHPAGHILGSAQVRIETEHTVCVISGDYKRMEDPSCEPFKLLKCDIFVTESTFGLPIYHWEKPTQTIHKILTWWEENRTEKKASVLFCYSLGKAQRLLAMLKKVVKSPLYAHGSILTLSELYLQKGIELAPCLPISEKTDANFSGELILAPLSAKGTPWMKRFFPYKTAFASGWMQVRGMRKRKNLDRGFALSDHADWKGLVETVKETEASLILTTHGNAATLARYLQEQSIKAYPLLGTEWMEEGEN